jgi:Fe-Mn family superoxide dismutase
MTVTLPPLPYDYHALEPVISAATLKLHHDAHHRTYVEKANALLKNSPLADRSLEEVLREAGGALFNNAAQAWNHAFFWKSLRPYGAPASRSSLKGRFAEQLKGAATGVFGSGWVWLVEDGGELKVSATSNAGTPLTLGQKPLLVIDVWEHAYYLDHQNRRDHYVEGVVEHLLDWEFAERNLAEQTVQA